MIEMRRSSTSVKSRVAQVAASAALGLSLAVGSAHAAEVEDLNLPGIGGTTDMSSVRPGAQSFTPQRSGYLTRVVLQLQRTGTVSGVTVSMWNASSDAPTSQVTTQTLSASDVAAISAVSPGPVSVQFTQPAQVQAGSQYAIVVTSTAACAGFLAPCIGWQEAASPYTGGKASATFDGGSSWQLLSNDYAFITYVDDAWTPPTNRSTDASSPTRTLQFQGVSECATQSGSALESAWLRLPTSADCSRVGYTLLGWSTSSAFPVSVAKSQFDKGWGAIDDTFDGVRMIFIPAGGSTLLSGDNTLHAIWSPA